MLEHRELGDAGEGACLAPREILYPNLAQMAYQAVRLLSGDIRPEQFMTGPGEDDGFFDALANGPVSATDPRALGGDLVGASLGAKP